MWKRPRSRDWEMSNEHIASASVTKEKRKQVSAYPGTQQPQAHGNGEIVTHLFMACPHLDLRVVSQAFPTGVAENKDLDVVVVVVVVKDIRAQHAKHMEVPTASTSSMSTSSPNDSSASTSTVMSASASTSSGSLPTSSASTSAAASLSACVATAVSSSTGTNDLSDLSDPFASESEINSGRCSRKKKAPVRKKCRRVSKKSNGF